MKLRSHSIPSSSSTLSMQEVLSPTKMGESFLRTSRNLFDVAAETSERTLFVVPAGSIPEAESRKEQIIQVVGMTVFFVVLPFMITILFCCVAYKHFNVTVERDDIRNATPRVPQRRSTSRRELPTVELSLGDNDGDGEESCSETCTAMSQDMDLKSDIDAKQPDSVR